MQVGTASSPDHQFGDQAHNLITHARSTREYDQAILQESDSIRISRVLCIFCMAYVHVHLLDQPAFESTWYFSSTRTLLADLFGRSSVPLLSMISGVLLVGVVRKRSLLKVAQGRARGLLVPMVVWNLIGLALAILTARGLPQSPLNAVLALTGPAHYVHLTFLRDVFVVSLGTPLYVLLAKRVPALFLLGAVVLTSVIDLKPLILRDQIFLYYVVGVYIGVYRFTLSNFRSLAKTTHIAMGCLVISALITQYAPQLARVYYHSVFEDLVRRPICALWFWLVARQLARNLEVRQVVRQHLEPAIFLMFLSHATVIHVVGSLYARFVPPHAISYFGVWLFLPPACLLVAVVGNKVLSRLPPIVSLVLTGQSPTSKPTHKAVTQDAIGAPPIRPPQPHLRPARPASPIVEVSTGLVAGALGILTRKPPSTHPRPHDSGVRS